MNAIELADKAHGIDAAFSTAAGSGSSLLVVIVGGLAGGAIVGGFGYGLVYALEGEGGMALAHLLLGVLGVLGAVAIL